jgi:hypothetical protein
MHQILPETIRIDGVDYKLPQWLEIGHSFFAPCVDPSRALPRIEWHYSGMGWKLRHAARIERGLYGVRVWRVK